MVESTIQKLLNSGGNITSQDVISGYRDSVIAKSETNDCVVKALAVVGDKDYDTAHEEAKRYMKRVDRKGVKSSFIIRHFLNRPDSYEPVVTEPTKEPIGGYTYTVKLATGELLKTTYKLKNGKELKCGMTVGTFAKRYNKGRYFVVVRRHAFSVVDGVIVGKHDDPSRKRIIVDFAFRAK
jgi:hypothetical protein